MLLVETCSLVFLPAKYQEKEASASREIAKLTGWFEDFMHDEVEHFRARKEEIKVVWRASLSNITQKPSQITQK